MKLPINVYWNNLNPLQRAKLLDKIKLFSPTLSASDYKLNWTDLSYVERVQIKKSLQNKKLTKVV